MFAKIKSIINGINQSNYPSKQQGLFLIDEKTGETYYDPTAATRIKLRDIVVLDNEISRLAIATSATNKGFYYVIDTNQLFFYSGSVWKWVNPFGYGN